MDAIVPLLTTTEGRIGRQQWWIGIAVLVVAAIVVSILLAIISFGNTTLMTWGGVLISLAMIYPSYCIGIKRRHDRDNDGKDLMILIGVSVVLNLLPALGIGVTMVEVGGGVVVPMPDFWLSAIQLVFLVFAIYMLVQLGFLAGTKGPNSYGDDPLGD